MMTATDIERLFRDAMANFCSGVAVVTGVHPDGRPCGLLATSVSSFSSNPPSVMASIAHTARSHDALTEGPGFGINVLGAEQEHIGRAFSSSAADKFTGLDWQAEDEIPRLDGALSFLRCRRSAAFKLYDHTVIVGDILGGALGAGEPLVYVSRSMHWRIEPMRSHSL